MSSSVFDLWRKIFWYNIANTATNSIVSTVTVDVCVHCVLVVCIHFTFHYMRLSKIRIDVVRNSAESASQRFAYQQRWFLFLTLYLISARNLICFQKVLNSPWRCCHQHTHHHHQMYHSDFQLNTYICIHLLFNANN